MKTGFIGAGKVGFSLGKYFHENGVEISGYYSRTYSSAEEAASLTDSTSFTDISELVDSSDIIFVTVNDSNISSVWESIRCNGISGKIFCHCSGIMTSDVFYDAEKLNAYPCSLHMLQAVSSKYTSYKDMGAAVFTFESKSRNADIVRQLIINCGNKALLIKTEQKAKYHTAASVTSNLVNALIHEGYELLSECGFSYDDSKTLIEPLIRNNINNIFNYGTVDSLTGPVERNDIETVKKHIDCLNGNNKIIYLSAALKLTEISSVKNPGRDYTDMQMLLKNALKGEAGL